MIDQSFLAALRDYIAGSGLGAGYLLPEYILLAAAVVSLLVSLGGSGLQPVVRLLAIGGALLAAGSGWGLPSVLPDQSVWAGMLHPDRVSVLVRVPVCLLTGLLLGVWPRPHLRGETAMLILIMGFSVCLMSMATQLMMMFMALEFASICGYLLAGFHRQTARQAEASVKYLLYGMVSAALSLYGFSWLYGLTGSLMPGDPDFTTTWGWQHGLMLVLGLSGILFKISAVPFHFWAPDVYEGVSWHTATLLALLPKAGGILLLMRLSASLYAGGGWAFPVSDGLAAVAILSMTLGNLAALSQQHLRRMMAYAGIAQAGYLLLGILAAHPGGMTATLFYLLIYTGMTGGAFLLLDALGQVRGREDLAGLAGLGKKFPLAATALTICLTALVGLPPTAGFIGKWQLISSLLDTRTALSPGWAIGLAVAAILNTVLSLFFYFRIPIQLFLRSSDEPITGSWRGSYLIPAYALAVLVLGLGMVGFDRILDFIAGVMWNF
ncbi:MAG: NADH-quinone oxidoreductase subunit N [Bacteroidia bacterium]|nr:NADH-quinone oxidoreductase subunit N [Bacteroidia bacterium]